MNKLTVLFIIGLFLSSTSYAKSSRSACVKGEIYKQTKTLHLYSHKLRADQRLVRSIRSPYIMKVVGNKGWGCKILLFRKAKNGSLTPQKNGEAFTIAFRYFKKGTIATVVKEIVALPKKIEKILTPIEKSCEELPKEKYQNPAPVAENTLTDLEKYGQSKEVNMMITALKKNCSKFCCANNCRSKLPYRLWCRGNYKRFWDMGIKTRKCSRSLGRCYGHAKLGLAAGGFLDEFMKKRNTTYPWTSSPHAKKAGTLLKEAGFTNVLTDLKYKDKKITPYNCPKGAVLVYGAAGRSSGHIEIVDVSASGNRKYYSDFVGNKPIYDNPNFPSLNKKNRPIIGIYIKEQK